VENNGAFHYLMEEVKLVMGRPPYRWRQRTNDPNCYRDHGHHQAAVSLGSGPFNATPHARAR